MGPEERQLRLRLGDGTGLTRSEASAIGTVARVVFDRLVSAGATEEREGRRVLRAQPILYGRASEEVQRRKRETEERQRRYDEEQARRQREAAERAERERQERILWANVADYARDERPIVIAERRAALAESLAILNANKGG